MTTPVNSQIDELEYQAFLESIKRSNINKAREGIRKINAMNCTLQAAQKSGFKATWVWLGRVVGDLKMAHMRMSEMIESY